MWPLASAPHVRVMRASREHPFAGGSLRFGVRLVPRDSRMDSLASLRHFRLRYVTVLANAPSRPSVVLTHHPQERSPVVVAIRSLDSRVSSQVLRNSVNPIGTSTPSIGVWVWVGALSLLFVARIEYWTQSKYRVPSCSCMCCCLFNHLSLSFAVIVCRQSLRSV